ncbi:MAG: hypothetical protein APR53_00140 [Methanoculleus sp. SDB]|nr:MAG: hypothetical protein APR53_00140 [Methanoculleus sp. SDB]
MNLRLALSLGLLFAMISCGFAGCVSGPEDAAIPGNLTLATVAGGNVTDEKVFGYTDILALPSYTGNGYAVSTVGIKYGPYVCTGVKLADLVALLGEPGPDDSVWVSAPDGYMWVFEPDQMDGRNFITFDEDLKEIPSPPLTIVLMYEQDGKPLAYNDGAPFRIAITSEEPGVITEGSAWVKWVNRIEVHRK